MWSIPESAVIFTRSREASSRQSPLTAEYTDTLEKLEFNRTGTVFLSCEGNAVQIIDSKTGTLLKTLMHSDEVRTATFSNDGTQITSAVWRDISVWNISSSEPICTIKSHTQPVISINFSPDDSRVISADSAGTTRISDATSGQNLDAFAGDAADLQLVQYDHTGTAVIFVDSEGVHHANCMHPKAELLVNKREARTLDVKCYIESLSFDKSGETLMSDGDDGVVNLWATSTGESEIVPVGDDEYVFTAAFSPSHQQMAYSFSSRVTDSDETGVKIINAISGETLHLLEGPVERVSHLAFSGDGTLLAAHEAERHKIKVWSTQTGQKISEFESPYVIVDRMSFLPTRTLLLTCGPERRRFLISEAGRLC